MDIEQALQKTLDLVQGSRSSLWATDDAEEIARHLRTALDALAAGVDVDVSTLRRLFAPTGSIQDTSLDNGWGDEYLALSEVVDAFLAGRKGAG
jgi:hypothetical protein